tara:strand:- start:1589 stop:2515 length:927 start_codon:yes stop_codon:yes gene_type:complete
MATTTNITTTYAGQFAGEYIGAALLSGNTLANQLITIKPNIKLKEVIKKVDYASAIAVGTCNFDPQGTVTLTERILQPDELQVNIELCKTPFQSDWEAESMGYSAHDQLPPKFSDFFIARISADVAAGTESRIWGANGFTGLFLDAAFGTAGGTTIAPAAVTSSNVIAEMGKVVDAIPSALYGKEDLLLYVSQNVARAYVRALGGFGTFLNGEGNSGTDAKGTQWYDGGQGLTFDGVKVVVANGLADNRMVAAEKTNLFFGTGLLNDYNQVKVLDMADLDGSQNVRFVMRYTAGVQYGIASDIVFYGA